MQTEEQYLQLHALHPGAGGGEAVEITLGELAELWFCTPRNVKIVIRKMTESGWLEWIPGRGRGHTSRVRFRADREEMLLAVTTELVHKGRLSTALDWINRYGSATEARTRFMEWLNDYFGYAKETDQGKGRERKVETLRFPLFRVIHRLDPAETIYAFDVFMLRQIFDTLLTYDAVKKEVLPGIAHYWEANADRTVWQLYLRRGVLFHHGREVEAEDVVYSLNRCRANGTHMTNRWLLKDVDRIETLDERGSGSALPLPTTCSRGFCASRRLPSSPGAAGRAGEAFFEKPVGTGPFRVDTLMKDRCVLEANPGYYRGRAHLDRVEISILPAEHERSVPWDPRKGQLFINHGEFEPLPSVQDWEKILKVSDGCSLLTFNLNKEGPQQSKLFRKALHHLVDRGRMIRELGGDRLYPASGWLPGPEPKEADVAYDPDQGRALLEQSGYNGEPLHLFLYGKHERDARWLAKHLASFGIRLEITVTTWAKLRNAERVRAADAILYEVCMEVEEVTLLEIYLRDGEYVRMHLSPEVRARIGEMGERLVQLPEEEERADMFRKMEELLKEEGALLFLLHKELNTSYNRTLRGIQFNSLGWVDFKDLWFQHQR
ncbi:ABC transporter substrate-binding protein [Paenibacillus sp. CC-CFT747]|nr:ABC transporter substrate-binding protein [Paenibacillus sp. CC-CFT747]